jgi:hypothetical protein
MSSPPDAILEISAYTGAFAAVQMIDPTSYPGPVDASVVLSNLAVQGGFAFENHGVSVMLDRPYFWGSVREQMLQCMEHADIEWNGLQGDTLAIWPKGGTRGGLIPLISPETGMLGYPTNWQAGLAVTTLFNPQLRIGGEAQMKSSLPFANMRVRIVEVSHELESETPNGRWFTTFHGFPSESHLYHST